MTTKTHVRGHTRETTPKGWRGESKRHSVAARKGARTRATVKKHFPKGKQVPVSQLDERYGRSWVMDSITINSSKRALYAGSLSSNDSRWDIYQFGWYGAVFKRRVSENQLASMNLPEQIPKPNFMKR